MTPKSRFWTDWMVSGLKIFAVAVAWVAGLTAAAGVAINTAAAMAATATNLVIDCSPLLHRPNIVTAALTSSAYGFAQTHG
jgi:hypothetical protein